MKVKPLPVFNLNSVSESLRQLANRLESGEYQSDRVVVAIEYSDGECSYAAFGKEPFSKVHAIGILHGAIDSVLHKDR